MNAEIITIGDELLLGQVIDTNSAWLGLKLAESGIEISRRIAVGDSSKDIKNAIAETLLRVNLVIITGGLGPTRDDLTKQTLCEYYQCGLRYDEDVAKHLEKVFADRGRKMLQSNRDQAEVPEICKTLHNNTGTAPGMLFDINGKVLISLPGVPGEMKHIMESHVIPWLPERFQLPHIYYKTLLSAGIPESILSQNLSEFESNLPEYIKLAYLPAFNSIRLRLYGKGTDKISLINELNLHWDELLKLCGNSVVFEGDSDMAAAMAKELIKKNKTIAIAESCTGGYITNQLIMQPGISTIMKGGLVSYSNEIKHSELNVPVEIFSTKGAVSEECARFMAEGIRAKFDSDVAIATTGIAGPGGATDEKPVGLIYIGICNRERTEVFRLNLPGSREMFMQRACTSALNFLRRFI